MSDFDEYYEATEPELRERAFGWATAIGLQQVDGLTPSKYLIQTARRNIEGEITCDEARRLVDSYYETRLGHEEPTGHQEADKVSARMNQLIHVPAKQGDDVVNDVVNFSVMEERAVKLLLKDSRLSAARLAEALGVKQRQAQRIIASLKAKAGLKRRGSDKTGEWYFETLARDRI